MNFEKSGLASIVGEKGLVGLVVVTYKDNFGSALQTYATQRVIRNLGFETAIFRIEGVQEKIAFRKALYFARRAFQKEEFKYIANKIKSLFKKKRKNQQYSNNMLTRHQKYVEFYQEHLLFFEQAEGWEGLSNLSKSCSSVVVGSDQLWRPSNIAGGYFTLEFVPESIKKIAYSTSFGVSVIPGFLRRKTKEFLARMDYISVRENSGVEIIKNILGKTVPTVCDPTMLLTINEWQSICAEEPIYQGDYIVCYLMGSSTVHREFVMNLRDVTKCRVIGLMHGSVYVSGDDDWPDETPYDVGPGEFINLIKHAKYVCTDSFHCCVFSIMYQTEFFAFRRDAEIMSTSSNDRLYTLLSWTGLSSRLFQGNEPIEKVLNMKIDYDSVEKKVIEKRVQSMGYLTESLESKGENDA